MAGQSAPASGNRAAQFEPARRRRLGPKIIEVIIVVLLVTSFIFLNVFIIRTHHGLPGPPTITFDAVTKGGTSPNRTAQWNVATTSRDDTFSNFEIQLLKDDIVIGNQTLVSNHNMTFSIDVCVIINDTDGNGELSVSDTFFVYRMINDHQWKLVLRWAIDIASQTWSTHPRFIGAVISRTADGVNWEIMAASVSAGLTIVSTTLTVRKHDDTVNLGATPFASLTFAVHGAEYHDTNGNGLIDVGERLLLHTSWYGTGSRVTIMESGDVILYAVLS